VHGPKVDPATDIPVPRRTLDEIGGGRRLRRPERGHILQVTVGEQEPGGKSMRMSARNQIRASVTSITTGEAIANVELDAGGIRMVASITTEAARELGLAKGNAVTAVIKASNVILAVAD
jgi:molybdopterin-binding protein